MVMRVEVINHSSHKDAPVDEIKHLVSVQLFHVENRWAGASHVVSELIKQGFYHELVDDLPEAPGALGYHSIDAQGRPFAKTAVNPSLQNGSDWLTGPYSVVSVVGHEACETVGNPIINIERDMSDTETTAQELCDAVEDTGYHHEGADLTNFLLPSWFNPFGEAPFDYCGALSAPFTMTPGGYMIVTSGGKTTQKFGAMMPIWRMACHTRTAMLLSR